MSSAAAQASVRGWCPGALRPMQSGDGLIVRLRPRGGAFTCNELARVACLAARYGNGQIDLTRRANLQIRGLSQTALPTVWSELRRLRLLDASADAEAVRNVMVSPLAGLDATEVIDLRPVAEKLELALAQDPRLWKLPGKFGFIVDGGGRFHLDADRADIRLKACVLDGVQSVALGLDRCEGTEWIGHIAVDDAADSAIGIARAFLDVSPSSRARMRDLDGVRLHELCARAAIRISTLPAPPPVSGGGDPALGLLANGENTFSLGLAAPFGRITAVCLERLACAARDLGVGEIRLSPWRTLFVPVSCDEKAKALALVGVGHGLIVDPADPLRMIEACPGSSGCRSASFDTYATARRVAAMLAGIGCRSCHVSGCSKGCASSRVADLVLVGAETRVGVLRRGTPQGVPEVYVSADHLSQLPAVLATL